MARTPGPVPPAPSFQALVRAGIGRDRALLAARVGGLRVQRGWTYHVLGKQARINGTYLRELEDGRRNPSLEELVKLARVFELSALEQLFGELPSESAI